MQANSAYAAAAQSGRYEKPTGLKGKYDNVRRFWEDEVTRYFSKPYLKKLVQQRQQEGKKLRIMDLGCGCGDGYDWLINTYDCDKELNITNHQVLPESHIEIYHGLDLSEDLLAQGENLYAKHDKVCFTQKNFNDGLGLAPSEKYDFFLATYGTLSHCKDDEAVELLAEIAQHSSDGALFVGDWLGCYSCEWKDLWEQKVPKDYFMDYVISYIYDEEERDKVDLESFKLRLMNRKAMLTIVEEAAKKAGVQIEVKKIFDRSLFVGRHMETGTYRPFPQPIRTHVNSLLEPEIRTDLQKLKVSYLPKKGFERLNKSFQKIQEPWNALVDYSTALLESKREAARMENKYQESPFLSRAFNSLRHVVENNESFWRDTRANIIEPELFYMLRQVEISYQQGNNMGHGFCVALEINK